MKSNSRMASINCRLALTLVVTIIAMTIFIGKPIDCDDPDSCSNILHRHSKSSKLAMLVSDVRGSVRAGRTLPSSVISAILEGSHRAELLYNIAGESGEEKIAKFKRLIGLLEAREECFRQNPKRASVAKGVRALIEFMNEQVESHEQKVDSPRSLNANLIELTTTNSNPDKLKPTESLLLSVAADNNNNNKPDQLPDMDRIIQELSNQVASLSKLLYGDNLDDMGLVLRNQILQHKYNLLREKYEPDYKDLRYAYLMKKWDEASEGREYFDEEYA